ncbi:MAG: hypothetical protein Roseis2KO_44000 [Roseivirga sp.]
MLNALVSLGRLGNLMKKAFLFFVLFFCAKCAFGQFVLTQGSTQLSDGTFTNNVILASYDFGPVAVGSSKDATFLVTNNYSSTDFTWLTTSSSITGPFTFMPEPTGTINSAGGTTTFTIRYTPTATSGTTGEAFIVAYFLQGSPFRISLSGGTPSNAAPAISGTVANQAVNDNSTLSPFSGVTVSDGDGDNVSATITLDAAAKGALSGSGLSDDGGGVYSIASTSAADLQTKLRALVFNPTDNRSSSSETTTFTLAVSDGTDTSSDNTTTVVSSAVAPAVNSITLSGSPAANATSVDFTVTFSESVTGVDINDFSLDASGASGTISNVAGSGASYTVTVSSLAGNGTVSIDLNASSTGIADTGGKAIASGFTSGSNHTVLIVTSATMDLTVYLEGAYNGTNLNTAINSSIPLSQPYTHNGHSGGTASTIPAGAVDWVLVELREAASAVTALASTKVGSAAGFLMSDGSIKAVDGTSNLSISLTGNNGASFYVVIYHRNHLPIMSAAPVSNVSNLYSVDFTTVATNTYLGATALTTLTGAKLGMIAGDVDGDGDVDATDLTTWRTQNGAAFVYNTTNGDLNLDGAINAIDRNAFQQKNDTKTSQVPTT